MTSLCLTAAAKAEDMSEQTPAIIPYPQKLERRSGEFKLTDKSRIVVDATTKETGVYLSEVLAKITDIKLPVVEISTDNFHEGDIEILVSNKTKLGEEGYQLDVEPNAVRITGASVGGAFYGVQTLRQIIWIENHDTSKKSGILATIPCLHIEDEPRFRWRGLMLDVCRHFFTVEEVKRFIDLMALYKFNTFHWHLTEDQGWRIEIKKYPKLTEIGAWRDDGHGGKYGGFYTQDEIRAVVAYAAARHITVVPEIEMPGHSQAALASYPELSCTGGPFEVGTHWGIYKEVYCAGKDQTFEFLQNVLTEVLDLFPSSFICIGGDECPKNRWKACPACQVRIKAEGLKDEHELQSYFVKRIETFLMSKGRRLVGWDEILEGGLAPNATVLSWHGTAGAVTAAKADHDVVLSPVSHCYLDGSPLPPTKNENSKKRHLLIETVYSFNPVPIELSSDEARHVLGAQGNLWTENIETAQRLDYMTYPRACALAEVLWSPSKNRTWDDFHRRLTEQFRLLDTLHVDYCKELSSAQPN